MKMNKQIKIIIGLSLALILLIGFIGYGFYTNYQERKQTEIYKNGINDALITLLTEIQNNGFVQIPFGNQTITLVQYQEQ